MNSGLGEQLRARSSAYSSEYSADTRPEVTVDAEVGELRTLVERRRRGRAGLAAASALCLVLVALAAYAVAGGRGSVGPAASPAPSSPLAVLGTVGPDDGVLTVAEADAGDAVADVVVVHAGSAAVERVAGAEVRQALGPDLSGWPSITLVAIEPQTSRAVFLLNNSLVYGTPRIAVYSWATAQRVEVLDPCTESLDSIDVYRWCPVGLGAEATANPSAGGVENPAAEFVRCVSSGVRLGEIVSQTCATADGATYLYLTDLASGKSSTFPLGPGPLQPPMVVGGMIFENTVTTEGDPVLVTSGAVDVAVGGAPARGLGVVDGRLLVVTSSDRWGADSTYGRAIGLWSPGTGDFERLNVPIDDATTIGYVAVSR